MFFDDNVWLEIGIKHKMKHIISLLQKYLIWQVQLQNLTVVFAVSIAVSMAAINHCSNKLL